MTVMKTVLITAALVFGASQIAMAQGTGSSSGSSMGGSTSVNGQQKGTGPAAKTYGTKQGQGREQPEEKQDMGTGAGK